MNSPFEQGHDELRFAEYALGVLDAEARRAVEREMDTDPQATLAVEHWQQRLAPLADDIAEVAPAPYVWVRLTHALGLPAETSMHRPVTPPREGLWDSLKLWRWVGVGASLAAVAAIALMLTLPRTPPTAVTAPAAGYMVATIQQDNGVTGWTATMDLQQARMVVVPATPAQLAADRSAELWLVPPGEKPISLGVIGRDKPTTVALSPALISRLSAQALLAVSTEPRGGSPTGQPTGPITAKGAISGA